MRAVLTAIESGASTRSAVARRTELPDDVVDAIIDHLVRIGSLAASALDAACGPAGCGGCTSAGTSCGPVRRSLPVVLTLRSVD